MRARTTAPPWDVAEARGHLAAADSRLAPVIHHLGDRPFAISPPRSLFAALVEAIVYQQLTGKAAATIHARVLAHYRPRRHPRPEDLLATPDATLRACGLSGAKTRALKDLAARTLAGELPTLPALQTMDDEAIARAVSTVRGIGRWTADMLLIFNLGRPDVLPVGDYGVQKGAQRLYRLRALPSPARLASLAERWRPWRSLGSWYMWRVLELETLPRA